MAVCLTTSRHYRYYKLKRLLFFIDERLTEDDFATMDFDKDKLKGLLNLYAKKMQNLQLF